VNARSRITALLFGGALVFALLGQFYFAKRREYLGDGIFFYAVAVVLFLILVQRLEGGRAPADAPSPSLWAPWEWVRREPLRASLLILSLTCSLFTLRLIKGKVGTVGYWDAFALWATSMAFFLGAFLKADDRWPSLRALTERAKAHRWEITLVGLCTVLGFTLRFVALDSIPANFGGDEGEMGMEAIRVLQGDLTNMFVTSWLSHPTLFFFLQALSLKLFGVNVFGLRMLSILIGTLTLPIFYLFVRQLFDQRTALVATAILVVSHFHIHFSRLGVNNIADPLFATLVLYLLYRGLQSQSSLDFVLSGLVMGLSQYFYMGTRLIPVIVAAFLGFLILKERDFLRDSLANLLVMAGAFLLAGLPLFVFFKEHPDAFMARLAQVGIIQSGWLAREPGLTGKSMYQILTEQFLKSVLGFHYYTDPTFWYRASIPLLDFLSSVLLVFGLAYSMYRFQDKVYFLLDTWFWSAVIFGGFLMENPPTSPRLVIGIPVVCILVALAIVKLARYAQELGFLRTSLPRYLILAGVVSLVAFLNLRYYFVEYTPTRIYGNPTAEIGTELSKYLTAREGDFRVYFFGPPRMYFTHGTIRFMAQGVEGMDVHEPLTGQPTFVDPGREAIFVFLPERRGELEIVRRYYPQGKLWEFRRGVQVEFIVYEVERP
jgi:hypothetical protein